jgi:hypothetical protein
LLFLKEPEELPSIANENNTEYNFDVAQQQQPQSNNDNMPTDNRFEF